MIILHLAWRNLWRNRRRTAITLVAISLNAAILIASYSLMDGLMAHIASNATNIVVGEVQIHKPKYLVDRSMYKDLNDPEGILSLLRGKGIMAAPRSYGYGLVARETKSAGALFWGVDPKAERLTFDLSKHMAKGRFLSDRPRQGLILGKKLARSLEADIGTEIVVVVQGADGSLGNELYRVSGILKTAGENIDRNAAIMHKTDFDTLFVSNGRVHEIALNTRGKVVLDEIVNAASQAAPQTDVKTWRQLMPSLSDMINLSDASIGFFGIIFFLAAALGILNTMLMATFERIREFGILKALGASPWRIMRDVAAEAFVLAALSTIIGAIIGIAGSYYLEVVGLDTGRFASGDITIAGVAFDPVWRASLSIRAVVMPVLVMWVFCLIASLYPAAIAARQDPVKAMAHV